MRITVYIIDMDWDFDALLMRQCGDPDLMPPARRNGPEYEREG